MTDSTDRAAAAAAPLTHRTIALVPENCTSCMICVRECPDWCIDLDAHQEKQEAPERSPGRAGRSRTVNVLDAFSIDFGLCMFCGICVEVCPHDALFWSTSTLPPAAASRDLVTGAQRLDSFRAGAPHAPLPAGAVDPSRGGSPEEPSL